MMYTTSTIHSILRQLKISAIILSLPLFSLLASCTPDYYESYNTYVAIPNAIGNFDTLFFVSSNGSRNNIRDFYYNDVLSDLYFTRTLEQGKVYYNVTSGNVGSDTRRLHSLGLHEHSSNKSFFRNNPLNSDSISYVKDEGRFNYFAYDTIQGSLLRLRLNTDNLSPLVVRRTDSSYTYRGGMLDDYADYYSDLYIAQGFTIVDAIKFSEHAMWSKGNPWKDEKKKWTIDSIFDSNMNPLITPGYDCLYDNSFTFYPGNKLVSNLGDLYCTDLDQPLLDQGQDSVFQQYAIIDEPGQNYPYVYITTPGELFAPQRMYMLQYDQLEALVSTSYGSDSIFLKLVAQ